MPMRPTETTDGDEWTIDNFRAPGGSSTYDVTTMPTDAIRSQHERIARRFLNDDHDDPQIEAFEVVFLQALTHELAFRRRIPIAPADTHDDVRDVFIELIEERFDVEDATGKFMPHFRTGDTVDFTDDVFAMFKYDLTEAQPRPDGTVRYYFNNVEFDTDALDEFRDLFFDPDETARKKSSVHRPA